MSSAYPIFQVVKACRQVKLICCIDLRRINWPETNLRPFHFAMNVNPSLEMKRKNTHTHTHFKQTFRMTSWWVYWDFTNHSHFCSRGSRGHAISYMLQERWTQAELHQEEVSHNHQEIDLGTKKNPGVRSKFFPQDPCMVYLPGFTIRIKHKT